MGISMSCHLWYFQHVTYVNLQVTSIILLCAKINICSMNKNQKNIFFFPPRSRRKSQVARFSARICARAIFFDVTRIQTHNLSLACTLPYHWATPSHVTNNEIFSFYHHFLMKNFSTTKLQIWWRVITFVYTFSIRGHLKILKI